MSNTQLPAPHDRGPCEVIVGLDFGTSCTKVVLRTPDEGDRAFAVPFGLDGHDSSPHLCPSKLWVMPDGSCSLRATGTGGISLGDLKTSLIRNKEIQLPECKEPRSVEPLVTGTAYLALVLKAVRRWFLTEQANAYRGFEFDWQVNLGLPSSDFNDVTLCSRYLELITAAWWLSVQEQPIDIASAADATCEVVLDSEVPGRSGLLQYEDDEYVRLSLFPEVAAEVAGYARSDLRNEGLHLLIDVGAGTLDVCGFILHASDNNEDLYELLTADVQPLGTMTFFQGRVEAIKDIATSHFHRLRQACDPVSPVPTDLEDYLPRLEDFQDGLRKEQQQFHSRCSNMLHKNVQALKQHRDPNSPRWRDRLPVFLCGGAGEMESYAEVVNSVSLWIANNFSACQGLEALTLDRPDKLEGAIDPRIYHRLAVAWGLSYPECDLGAVQRPDEINSLDRMPVHDFSDRFVSKDAV